MEYILNGRIVIDITKPNDYGVYLKDKLTNEVTHYHIKIYSILKKLSSDLK